MQSTDESYISADLYLAPEYHLAKNTYKELPAIEPDVLKSEYLDSLAEISAIQIFEDIPGIKKSRIPIDAKNLIEIWGPIPDRIFLAEDLEFLKADTQRVETVVKKLIWLGNSWLSSAILTQKTKVETWEDILNILQRYNYVFDFIAIAHHSPRIILETHNNAANEPTEYWGVYPNCWAISLIKTRNFNGGYIIDDYNTPYKFDIEVWVGIPFLRNKKTRELILRDVY